MVQPHHVALGDVVKDDRREEGEEANGPAEGNLQHQAVQSNAFLQKDVGKETQADGTAGIREYLHATDCLGKVSSVDNITILREVCGGRGEVASQERL